MNSVPWAHFHPCNHLHVSADNLQHVLMQQDTLFRSCINSRGGHVLAVPSGLNTKTFLILSPLSIVQYHCPIFILHFILPPYWPRDISSTAINFKIWNYHSCSLVFSIEQAGFQIWFRTFNAIFPKTFNVIFPKYKMYLLPSWRFKRLYPSTGMMQQGKSSLWAKVCEFFKGLYFSGKWNITEK